MLKTRSQTSATAADQKPTYTGEIPRVPLKYMVSLLKDNKPLVVVSIVAATMAELASTSLAFIIKKIVDTAEGVASGHFTHVDVMFWALLFPAVVFLADVLWRTSGFTGMRWMTHANAKSYLQLFAYLGKHSHSYFNDRFAGSLSNKVSHASDGVQSLYESFLWNYYPGILALFFTAVYIGTVSILAAAVFVSMLFVLVPMNIALAKYRRPHVIAFSAQVTKSRGFLVDALTNIGAVRQYSAHSYEQKHLDREFNRVKSLDLKQWGISEWGLVLNNIVIAVFQFAIVLIVLYMWRIDSLSTGELVMMMTLLLNVTGTLVFIGSSINSFVRRYAEVEEGLDDVLTDHEITDVPGAKTMTAHDGEITWSDVTFTYGQNKVFDHFGLTIKPGQRVGLVGPSGAGKTTFVSLLLRQHDLDDGAILIDGQDISKVTQDSLREAIAVVPQEPMLFHRSIRENIAYGKPDATDDEIIAVAKKAQAHDFIASLEDGYETLVGERGVKLSGGQKQRVAIARAMLKDAPILVLDEATSALDSESEVLIQKALHELMEDKTVIAVAHRLSTLREMDRILVLESGQIVEDGNHNDLSRAGGTYQRLWEHQAGGFVGE